MQTDVCGGAVTEDEGERWWTIPQALERKDLRRRGLASPDDGDALALTFAYPVERRNWQEEWRFREKLAALKRRIV